MPFKFSEIEGVDPELAARLDADERVQGAIDTHVSTVVENRIDVKAGEFKQKMEALDAKRKAAEERAANAPDIGAEELAALRQARDKNPELQATLDQMRQRVETVEAERERERAELESTKLDVQLEREIEAYDREFKTTRVMDGMRAPLKREMRERLRRDAASGALRVYDEGGNVVATDKGAATPIDLLVMMRKSSPGFFVQPSGSGATGSGASAAGGEKTMSRSEFGKLAPAKQAEVARSHTITDG